MGECVTVKHDILQHSDVLILKESIICIFLFICCYCRGDYSYRLRDYCHFSGNRVNIFYYINISVEDYHVLFLYFLSNNFRLDIEAL